MISSWFFHGRFCSQRLGKWDDQFGIHKMTPPVRRLMGWFTIGFTTLDLEKIEGWCGTAVEACVAVSAIDIYTSRICVFRLPQSGFHRCRAFATNSIQKKSLSESFINHKNHLPKIHEDPPEPACIGLADPENWLLLFV